MRGVDSIRLDESVYIEAIELLGYEVLARIENGPIVRVAENDPALGGLLLSPRYREAKERHEGEKPITGDTVEQLFEKLLPRLPIEELHSIDRVLSDRIRAMHLRQKEYGAVVGEILRAKKGRV